MEYDYVLTTYYDGEVFGTYRLPDFPTAVDTWNKCVDSGEAKTHARYSMTDPSGLSYSKSFFVKS